MKLYLNSAVEEINDDDDDDDDDVVNIATKGATSIVSSFIQLPLSHSFS